MNFLNFLRPFIFMKAKITWGGEVKFIAESESGHRIIMDGPPDYGGGNAGPRPMEMMLMGMGGCSAFDVVHILRLAEPG